MKRVLKKHNFLVFCITALIFFFTLPLRAKGQDIGATFSPDDYGEVEQFTYIESISDNYTIYAFTATENFDFSEEDIEYIGANGALFDGSQQVDGGFNYDYDYYEVDMSAATHVGDTYVVGGQSGACYYDYDDYGEGDDDGDCDFYVFDPVYFQLNTAVPQITSLSPSSANQGSSGTFTVQGTGLVDDFGFSQANIYGSGGVNVAVQSANSANSLTVQYSIDSNAATGDRNFSISTSFGESDYKKFTVGYPPAVVTSVTPNPWVAGTSFDAHIQGTGFGNQPIVNLSAYGVAPVNTTVSSDGSNITIPVTVAADAPDEPVSIQVQPGYAGSSFTCGTCNGGSPNGSSTVVVQAFTPAPQIMFNGTNISGTTQAVVAGQQIALSVAAPQGYTIQSSSWTFSNQSAITGGFVNGSCTTGTQPSASAGGCEASDPPLNQQALTFYWVNPGDNGETVTYTYTLDNGQSASATATFNIGGPSTETPPGAFVQPDVSGTRIENATNGSAVLGMIHAPGMPNVGIWFNDTAATPQNNPGQFVWIQILTSVNYSQLVASGSTYDAPQNALNQLDGVYPYPSRGQNGLVTSDAPARGLSSTMGEGAKAFKATMYLMWDPQIPQAGQNSCKVATTVNDGGVYASSQSTCASIPIPIASIDWQWSACAINSGAGANPSWFIQCGVATKTVNSTAGFPEWNSCYKSFFGKCS